LSNKNGDRLVAIFICCLSVKLLQHNLRRFNELSKHQYD